MLDLRTLCVAMALVCGPGAVLAQSASQLANIDSQLNALCARLQSAAGDDASAIRARLSALSRQRTAYLDALPPAQRAVELQRSRVSPQCLTLARGSGPSRDGRSAARKGYRGGGNYSAPPEPVPRRSIARNGTPRSSDSPSGPQPGSQPEAQLEEFFPWPPPAPSDRRLLQPSQLGGDPPATWGHVADRLIALMQRARYPTWGFYLAPGGFAVIPRIEQLDQNGTALAGTERWATEVKLASTSVLDGIFTVRRPKGIYRAIAFVITTDPRSGGPVTDPKRMLETARRWGLSGALDLPQALRSRPLTADQRLFALVYEFESELGGQTKVNAPGRWDLDWHFTNAGLALAP